MTVVFEFSNSSLFLRFDDLECSMFHLNIIFAVFFHRLYLNFYLVINLYNFDWIVDRVC